MTKQSDHRDRASGTGAGRTGLNDTAGNGGGAYSGGNSFEGNTYVLPSNTLKYSLLAGREDRPGMVRNGA